MTTIEKQLLAAAIQSLVLGLACFASSKPTSSWAYDEIALKGKANGGVLVLSDLLANRVSFIAISTVQGEEALAVLSRLVSAANACDEFVRHAGRVAQVGSSLRLRGLPESGGHLYAGTETGLGIPRPPMFLSGKLNNEKTEVDLFWSNPPGGYDRIVIVWDGYRVRAIPGNDCMFKDRTLIRRKHILKKEKELTGKYHYYVVGYKDGIPSNAGTITVGPQIQEELASFPFTDNLMPNWMPWSAGIGDMSFRQHERSAKTSWRSLNTPEDKPFVQWIGGTGGSYEGGMWRRFLGLLPGRRYRVSVRVNPSSLEQEDGKSEFSVHVCHDSSDGEALTIDQMSGKGVLPDGSEGEAAGRIALFETGGTANGGWKVVSTGDASASSISGDIVLPSDVNSITVWLRLRSKNVKTEVGVSVDWVAVEELGL